MFVLGACVVRRYSLTGRGTCVIEADNGPKVVKLSHPERARTPEYTFLQRAYASTDEYDGGKYAHMRKHLPTLVAKEDFDKCGPRRRILARQDVGRFSGRGSCILRATVYVKLVPMTEIRTADDLMKVMSDIAMCKASPQCTPCYLIADEKFP